MGGLEAYQRMSAIGQGKDRGGGSEKVLVEWLHELGFGKGKGKSKERSPTQLQVLEVGALKHDNYAPHSSWISCTPIDLRSRHPEIREQDYLLLDVSENRSKWDAISLSLVLNFVPDPHDRGKMLVLTHQFLRPSGLLFLVLPLPCVNNSRYLTPSSLAALLSHIGFAPVRERWRESGKVAYWLFQKTDPPLGRDNASAKSNSNDGTGGWGKKKVLREGGGRNNFCILL